MENKPSLILGLTTTYLAIFGILLPWTPTYSSEILLYVNFFVLILAFLAGGFLFSGAGGNLDSLMLTGFIIGLCAWGFLIVNNFIGLSVSQAEISNGIPVILFFMFLGQLGSGGPAFGDIFVIITKYSEIQLYEVGIIGCIFEAFLAVGGVILVLISYVIYRKTKF